MHVCRTYLGHMHASFSSVMMSFVQFCHRPSDRRFLSLWEELDDPNLLISAEGAGSAA